MDQTKITDIKLRQCELNCRAWMQWFGLYQSPPYPLHSVEQDRCFFKISWLYKSFRESVPRYGAEVTYHGKGRLLEIDFDYYNPSYGLYYAIMHFFTEFLYHKVFRTKTDPFKVAEGLIKRGIDVEILQS